MINLIYIYCYYIVIYYIKYLIQDSLNFIIKLPEMLSSKIEIH